jgi:hypothetical protein
MDLDFVETPALLGLGVSLIGIGAALIVAPRVTRHEATASRDGWMDPTLSMSALALGALLIVGTFYQHYYPTQRAMMLGEGIVLCGVGAASLITPRLMTTKAR